jgi:hypothetical protein
LAFSRPVSFGTARARPKPKAKMQTPKKTVANKQPKKSAGVKRKAGTQPEKSAGAKSRKTDGDMQAVRVEKSNKKLMEQMVVALKNEHSKLGVQFSKGQTDKQLIEMRKQIGDMQKQMKSSEELKVKALTAQGGGISGVNEEIASLSGMLKQNMEKRHTEGVTQHNAMLAQFLLQQEQASNAVAEIARQEKQTLAYREMIADLQQKQAQNAAADIARQEKKTLEYRNMMSDFQQEQASNAAAEIARQEKQTLEYRGKMSAARAEEEKLSRSEFKEMTGLLHSMMTAQASNNKMIADFSRHFELQSRDSTDFERSIINKLMPQNLLCNTQAQAQNQDRRVATTPNSYSRNYDQQQQSATTNQTLQQHCNQPHQQQHYHQPQQQQLYNQQYYHNQNPHFSHCPGTTTPPRHTQPTNQHQNDASNYFNKPPS